MVQETLGPRPYTVSRRKKRKSPCDFCDFLFPNLETEKSQRPSPGGDFEGQCHRFVRGFADRDEPQCEGGKGGNLAHMKSRLAMCNLDISNLSKSSFGEEVRINSPPRKKARLRDRMAGDAALMGLLVRKLTAHEPDLGDKVFDLGPSQTLARALLARADASLERADAQLDAARREAANSWQWRRGAFTETEREMLDAALSNAGVAADLAGLEDLARQIALLASKVAVPGRPMSNPQLDNILKNTGTLLGRVQAAVAARIGTSQQMGGRRARRTRARRPRGCRDPKARVRVPDTRATTRRTRPHTRRRPRKRAQTRT